MTPTTVRLAVLNEAGTLIAFDSNWVQRASGDHTEFVVSANERSAQLYLNEGQKLTFIARAFGEDEQLLAYGSSERVTTAGSSMSTAIELRTLLGTVSLAPRLPTNYVVAGQLLDLVLSVTPPGRDDLITPSTHFRADYAIRNGTARATTERGVRLTVGARSSGDLIIDAIATGFVTDGAKVTVGEVSAHTLALPFPTETVTDNEPPTISNLAFDDHQLIFTGVSADNIGLTLVELYDGPVRVATTAREFISAEVPEIYFPGGGTAFLTHLNHRPDGPTLTVVAIDHAGHESTLDLSLATR